MEEINGKDLRDLEMQVLRSPHDATTQQLLLTRSKLMEERYAVEIQARIEEPGRTLLWIRLCRAGNDSFRKVYDTVWEETIASSEGPSIERYALLTKETGELAADPSIRNQPESTFPKLYVQAA